MEQPSKKTRIPSTPLDRQGRPDHDKPPEVKKSRKEARKSHHNLILTRKLLAFFFFLRSCHISSAVFVSNGMGMQRRRAFSCFWKRISLVGLNSYMGEKGHKVLRGEQQSWNALYGRTHGSSRMYAHAQDSGWKLSFAFLLSLMSWLGLLNSVTRK